MNEEVLISEYLTDKWETFPFYSLKDIIEKYAPLTPIYNFYYTQDDELRIQGLETLKYDFFKVIEFNYYTLTVACCGENQVRHLVTFSRDLKIYDIIPDYYKFSDEIIEIPEDEIKEDLLKTAE
jgi:hypothetical protein